MSSLNALITRLEAGRPLVMGGDPMSSFLARGVAMDGAAPLGRAIREAPSAVAEHYQQEIAAGVDVLVALTGETMPRALSQIGMAFRSAALTGQAVDLALESAEAAPRPVAVAGLLGVRWIAPTIAERVTEEYAMHATRLAASGCELIVARGFSPAVFRSSASLARVAFTAAVASASVTEIPTWALIESLDGGRAEDGEPLESSVRAALEAGAQLVIFDVPSEAAGLAALERASRIGARRMGVLLAASPDSQHGALENAVSVSSAMEAWAVSCQRLIDAGALVIGGGAGTTARHVAVLVRALKGSGRSGSEISPLWPQPI